jgi:hypothetical protein
VSSKLLHVLLTQFVDGLAMVTEEQSVENAPVLLQNHGEMMLLEETKRTK